MNNSISGRIRERGVALLFALGILSLLLVLGLAFVANSVISRKIAYNNSTRSQAKILAAGAINRVAGAVMLYQYQLGDLRKTNNGTAGIDDILVTDLSTVVSHKSYKTDTSDAIHINDNGSLKATIDDQLADELPPYQRIRFDKDSGSVIDTASDDDFYSKKEGASPSDPLRKPTWFFVDNGKTGDDRRIIGRYAFRVLPPRSNSRINLAKVLDVPSITATDPLWKSINEVPLADTPLSFWTVPGTVTGSLAPSIDVFLQGWKTKWTDTDDTRKNNVKWVKRWFDDGTWPGDLEVFKSAPADDASGNPLWRFYHRFNVNRSDWGGAAGSTSLHGTALNSPAAVAQLMADPVEFRQRTGQADSADNFEVTTKDADSPTDSGLRFLNMIGVASDVGGFENFTAFRKQIAANLIDYCDTDSIPTSNIAAADWVGNLTEADTTNKWPKYTGNEKTPYINEFALMFNVEPEIVNPNSSNMQIKLTLTPTVLAELIDIYEAKPSGAYKLFLNLNNFTVQVNIMGKGNWTIPGTPATTGSFDKTEPKTFTFTFPSTPLEIDFPAGSWKTNGYALAGTALTAVSQSLDLGLASNPGITSVTDVTTSFQIASASFTIHGAALQDSDGNGVDFARWDQTIATGGAIDLSAPKMLFDKKTTTSAGVFTLGDSGNSFGLDPQDKKLFIAGMQAKDPRQNLFVSTDTTKNDWSDLSKINWVEYDSTNATGYTASGSDALLTMDLDLNQTALADILVKGLVNKEANPSGKSSAGTVAAKTLGDVETVTDPAWIDGTNYLSTAYIRNSPMLSLWELGSIHRAAQWQTINLKNAAEPGTASESSVGTPFLLENHMDSTWDQNKENGGTSYYDGDGAILDEVKLTTRARSYGKIDWNMFKTESVAFPVADNAPWFSALLKASDADWRGGYTLDSGSNLPAGIVTAILNNVGAVTNDLTARSQILREENSGVKVLIPSDATNDREQEEVAGKVMNLMKAGPGLVTTFQAVIIAQTIQDVGGGDVFRFDEDGNSHSQTAKYGTFDLDSSKDIYYDDITGEAKLLVTFDRNPSNGKIKVRNVELLDVKNYNARMQ